MDMVAEKLDAINQTLERQNKITQGMLELMRKPVNPLLKILTEAGVGVSVLGIIHIIDTVVAWFGG